MQDHAGVDAEASLMDDELVIAPDGVSSDILTLESSEVEVLYLEDSSPVEVLSLEATEIEVLLVDSGPPGPLGAMGPQGPQGVQGPPGADGGQTWSVNQVPTPVPDGITMEFTVPETYITSSLRVFLNGIRQAPAGDYTETSATTFTFIVAPTNTDRIIVDYRTM